MFHFSAMILLFLCFCITGATVGALNLPYIHGNKLHGNSLHGDLTQLLSSQPLGYLNQSSLAPIVADLLNSVDMDTVLENAIKNLGNSSTCLTKINTLASFANPTESIAYFDTLGKPASGLTRNFVGFNFLGSYDECMTLKNGSLGYYEWCAAHMTVNISLGPGLTFPVPVRWTLCQPWECREGDISTAVKSLFQEITVLSKGAVKLASFYQICNDDESFTAGAYIGMILSGLFVAVVTMATVYRTVGPVIKSILRPSSPGDKTVLVSEDGIQTGATPSTNKNHVPYSKLDMFVKCFALQDTMSDLTNTNVKSGQVLCLNGIRVLSINWVVLGHTYMYFLNGNGDFGYVGEALQRHSFDTISNGLPSVDSFFALSGFLVAYLLLKQLTKKGHLAPFEWIAYYVHRYIRLTVPFLMVILIEGFCYQVWFTGPQKPEVQGIPGCHKSWWTNLLYIQNLYPWTPDGTEQCVGQAWYLANDMQFYIIAPFFILPLFYKPKLGAVLLTGTVVASAITSGILTYHNNLGLSVLSGNPDAFSMIYIKPYTRIPPYLIGVAGGWFYWAWGEHITAVVHKTPMYIRVAVAVPLWLITFGMQYGVVYGPHNAAIGQVTQQKVAPMVDSVSYGSLARIAWGLAVIVQVLLCQCSLGGFINSLLSWKGWLLFSRLTYSVYLVHLGLLSIVQIQMRGPFFLQPAFQMAIVYLGVMFMSYIWGAVLYLVVELPVSKIERILYR